MTKRQRNAQDYQYEMQQVERNPLFRMFARRMGNSCLGRIITMVVLILIVVFGGGLFLTQPGNGFGNGSNNGGGGGYSGGATHYGVQLKTSGCVAHNGLADAACTPGDIISTATKDQICVPGYSSQVRNVPTSVKDQAYAEYGIRTHSTGEYEVDHLISLELGGSNDISNLWPEAANPQPGFHQKDQVENYLHDQVCSGALALSAAQREIATNWLAVYQNIPH